MIHIEMNHNAEFVKNILRKMAPPLGQSASTRLPSLAAA